MRGVIPEIDIWRAAQLMLKRYGDEALKESAARADELAAAGGGEWSLDRLRAPASPSIASPSRA